MNMTKRIYIRGIELEVEFDYSPPSRGARERGTGIPLEPDYGPEIDICSVRSTDDIYDLVEHLAEEIQEKITEEVANDQEE